MTKLLMALLVFSSCLVKENGCGGQTSMTDRQFLLHVQGRREPVRHFTRNILDAKNFVEVWVSLASI